MSSVSVYSDNEAPASVHSDAIDSSVMSGPVGFRETRLSLKRTGQRPYSFAGTEICTSNSHSVGPALWYELNIYRTNEGQYVLEVKLFNKSDKYKDRFSVHEMGSLEDMTHFLENYDAAVDVSNAISLEDHMPLSLLALEALSLKLRIEEARNQFRDLSGELLFQLTGH